MFWGLSFYLFPMDPAMDINPLIGAEKIPIYMDSLLRVG